jgi:hypothetical protein
MKTCDQSLVDNVKRETYPVMMQEHRWKARGARPINVWESLRNLNVGSYDRYFEARLNSVSKKSFEARLNDRMSEVGVSTPPLDYDCTRIAVRIGFVVDK